MAEEQDCWRCTRTMVTITLEIEARARTLRSCSHCDIREWEGEAGGTDLSGILDELSAASVRD